MYIIGVLSFKSIQKDLILNWEIVFIPEKQNTNDLLLTGLTHWRNPQVDILKIRFTTYGLRLTTYDLRFTAFIHDLWDRIPKDNPPYKGMVEVPNNQQP